VAVAGSALKFSVKYAAPWTPFEFGMNHGGDPAVGAFFASVVDNTFSDPCAHVERSPKVRSTVEAIATALGQIPGTTATRPVQATLAGHPATYIEITIPAAPPCSPDEFYLWQDSPDAYWWALAPNELIRVWIVDVGGEPIAIAARSRVGVSEAATAELRGILDSIVFDVPSTSSSPSPAAS
jgi:hypothetical protein